MPLMKQEPVVKNFSNEMRDANFRYSLKTPNGRFEKQ